MLSPDTEVIRRHLLALLNNLHEIVWRDRYPIGVALGATIIRQLVEFREVRALERLDWMTKNAPGHLPKVATKAAAMIRGEL